MYKDRKSFKKDNMRRFTACMFKFLEFYKSQEEKLSLEINITDVSEDFKNEIKLFSKSDAFLCFKISQHLEERKRLYVYFVCNQVMYNKEFAGFAWVSMDDKLGTQFSYDGVPLLLEDINNKILEYFGGK